MEYTLDDVLVTAGGTTQTLAAWQNSNVTAPTASVTNLDGTISFAFDDATGRPEDVIVYTSGTP